MFKPKLKKIVFSVSPVIYYLLTQASPYISAGVVTKVECADCAWCPANADNVT